MLTKNCKEEQEMFMKFFLQKNAQESLLKQREENGKLFYKVIENLCRNKS